MNAGRSRLAFLGLLISLALIVGQASIVAANADTSRDRSRGTISTTKVVSKSGKVSTGADSSKSTKTPTAVAGPSAAQASLNVNLDQYANGGNTQSASWVNGDLNQHNAAYNEGDVVPFRLAIEGLSAGSHTIHINYDFTAGGVEAYDFLATWDDTESPGLCDSGGGGVSSMCPSLGSADTKAFPSDSFAPGSPTHSGLTVAGAEAFSGVSRDLTMYGGSITSITGPTHSGPESGNSTGDFIVTFNSTGSAVLLAWGGHLAESAYWVTTSNDPNGAAEISGAPWHMRTQNLDGSGNKNQDRSIQPSAIVALPGLNIVKTADSTSVAVGSDIGFTITVTNTGNVGLQNVSVDDPLPAGDGVDWSIDNQSNSGLCSISGSAPSQDLSCGPTTLAASASFSVHITSPTSDAACVTYDNTATASADNVPDASSSDSITLTGCAPELTISKSDDAGGSVGPGDSFTYTVTVNNTGNADATGVVISDDLDDTLTSVSASYGGDAGSGNCNVAVSNVVTCPNSGSLTLSPGGTITVTIDVTTDPGICGNLPNIAHVDWAEDASGNGEDSNLDSVDVTGCAPDLLIEKTGASTVQFGQDITWTITVSNSGNADGDNVQVVDDLPAGFTFVSDNPSQGSCSGSGPVTCDLGTIAAGQSATVTITATAPSECGPFTNSASGTFGDSQDIPGSPATASGDVTGCTPGLEFSKSGPTSVSQGGTVTYHVLVSNTGNADTDPVTVTDTVPLSNVAASYSVNGGQPVSCGVSGSTVTCDLGSLAPGDTVDITITGTASNDNTCPTLHNTASVTVGESSQDTNTIDTTVTGCSTPPPPPPPPPPGSPALTITKTADAQTVLAGAPIGFTVTVSSTGSATATGVTLSDPLPSGSGISWSIAGGSGAAQCSISGSTLSCNFGDMAPGSGKSVHVTSPTTTASCGTYDNTATESSTNAGTHSASASTAVDCPAIQVVKSAHPDHGAPGETITYRYVVTNIGTVDLFDISVDDDVLGHICDIPLLHPGESQTCTKDYVIPQDANISIKNVVIAKGHDAEGNKVQDDDTVTIDVILGATVTPKPTKTPPAGVAFTGSSAAIPLGGIALLLLMVGTALMWLGRRGRRPTAG